MEAVAIVQVKDDEAQTRLVMNLESQTSFTKLKKVIPRKKCSNISVHTCTYITHIWHTVSRVQSPLNLRL